MIGILKIIQITLVNSKNINLSPLTLLKKYKKYKNINYLDPNTSHIDIIKNGTNYVLNFGSVAFEYPYFNIPVITATKNIPTSVYNFNLITKNKSHLKKILLNLKKNFL